MIWVFTIKETQFSDLGVHNQGNSSVIGCSQSRKHGSVIWVFTIKETQFSDWVFTVTETQFSDWVFTIKEMRFSDLGVHNQGNVIIPLEPT